ncbi:unnamed protein product, partial [Musa acuminata var. zebrina]
KRFSSWRSVIPPYMDGRLSSMCEVRTYIQEEEGPVISVRRIEDDLCEITLGFYSVVRIKSK